MPFRNARRIPRACLLFGIIASAPRPAIADENGVSAWLPGTFGSLAAVQQQPGWSLGTVYYHPSVWGGSSVAGARQISVGRFDPTLSGSLNTKLNAHVDLGLVVPSYVFASPILGGQLAVSAAGIVGGNRTSISGNLSGNLGSQAFSRSASASDDVVGIADLFPQASLRWQSGVHNFLAFAQTAVPIGTYRSTRLANLGFNHWALDGGGGYTYFDKTSGRELSAVAGFTYNFINQATHYRNGSDFHLDLGASQFLSEHWHVGAVAYVYEQITADAGQAQRLGSFKSGVIGVGPQIGYITSVASHPLYLNLKSYGEFNAVNRPSGYNVWLTASFKL